MTFQESMQQAGEEILDSIAVRSAAAFRSSSGMAVPGKVTSRTGALLGAVLGGAGGERVINTSGDPIIYSIAVKGTALPYASLIHEGGVRRVTDKMRRFFWAKWHNTAGAEKKMFGILRFKNIIKYLPRPYLEQGVDEAEIIGILRRHGIEFLRLELRKSFTGGFGATTLRPGT